MATARLWTIKVIVDDLQTCVIEGKGKANKEKELRRVGTQTGLSVGPHRCGRRRRRTASFV